MIGRPKLVLASGSPRRLGLINQAGIEPDALRPADIDETPKRGELPRACANRLARGKAEAALESVRLDDELRGAFILAADTVVAVGRRILPKAELLDEAAQCLRLLSGRNHRVYTGGLPGDADGGLPPAAGRDPGALQAALARRTSKPISPPANGAARPAATPCRASPAPSSSSWSAPTPTWSACRSTRRSTLLGGRRLSDPLRLAQRHRRVSRKAAPAKIAKTTPCTVELARGNLAGTPARPAEEPLWRQALELSHRV